MTGQDLESEAQALADAVAPANPFARYEFVLETLRRVHAAAAAGERARVAALCRQRGIRYQKEGAFLRGAVAHALADAIDRQEFE